MQSLFNQVFIMAMFGFVKILQVYGYSFGIDINHLWSLNHVQAQLGRDCNYNSYYWYVNVFTLMQLKYTFVLLSY